MKSVFIYVCLSFFITSAYCQGSMEIINLPNSSQKIKKVEVACGQCKFGLPGKSCDLAVRMKGKAYFVDGTIIDDHGDAHAKDGFCNAIRKAEVQGTIVGDRFQLTYFKLFPLKEKKEN